MFEDSLFFSDSPHHHRGWAAMVSFVAQAVLVGAAVVLPVLFNQTLPLRALRQIVAFSAPPPILTEDVSAVHESHHSITINRQALQMPRSIPRTISTDNNPPSVPDLGRDFGTRAGGGMDSGDQMSSLLISGPTVMPILPKPPAKRYRVSGGVEQGLLVKQVKPVYPALARQAGVQGEVILQAVISKDGRIEHLHVINGSPLLVKAAVDAVQQWRYRPYLLNGEPVEVETQITVSFKMS